MSPYNRKIGHLCYFSDLYWTDSSEVLTANVSWIPVTRIPLLEQMYRLVKISGRLIKKVQIYPVATLEENIREESLHSANKKLPSPWCKRS